MEHSYNDIEIYLNNYNKLKGWRCYNNNLEITISSNKIIRFCNSQEINVQNIKQCFDPIECSANTCVHQGLLTAKKIAVKDGNKNSI